MKDNTTSLIKQAEQGEKQQLKLFSSAEMPAELFAEDEAKGTFTGERLFKQDPEKYHMIVSGLAEGMGIRQLARAFHVSPGTIQAVRDREQFSIGTEKERIATNLRNFSRVASERLIEEVDNIPLQSLPVAIGISVEKFQLLEGQATARTEHIHRLPGMEDFNRTLELLPTAVEVVSETGPGEEKTSQKGAALRLTSEAAAAAEDADRSGANEATTDCQSPVSEGDKANDTTCDTAEGAKAGGNEGVGGPAQRGPE
jgi:hypothetical protein